MRWADKYKYFAKDGTKRILSPVDFKNLINSINTGMQGNVKYMQAWMDAAITEKGEHKTYEDIMHIFQKK